jgi:hypothetical protein
LHAFRAVGSRSGVPDSTRHHLNQQATAAARSRSNGSRSSQPGQLGQTPPAPAVLRKTPQVFRNSQIYPFTLEVSLQFSPFSLF